MFQSVAAVVRFLVSLVFLAIVSAGSWFGYTYYSDHNQILAEQREELERRAERITSLEVEVQEKDLTIARLDLALRLLKVDRRMAQLVVVGQEGSAEAGDLVTFVKFVEVDEDGVALGEPREFRVEGDVLYVDAWVVKFDDELVEGEDPLRSASICLFRRLFGERQTPADGFVLDNPFERPAAYGGDGEPGEFERQIWQDFWDYANDPDKASSLGIRAAHGEAPSIQLRKDKVYELSLRASGGLSITPRNPPAVLIRD